MDILDICFKSATILIALINLFFAIKFFYNKDKKDGLEKERDRKIQWVKTLILDHSLKRFYDFFEKLESNLVNLKKHNATLDEKKIADDNIADAFISLRKDFTNILLAVDNKLYDMILETSDKLQTHLTNTIFDEGINLGHQPKYDELVLSQLTNAKTQIIKNLFAYRG